MSYSASAQTAPVSVVGGLDLQRPTTADLLRSRGVDTSQSSLITALSNGNRDVKSLAARQLIENKTPQSVAAVENALSTEKDILTRINIASVLANTEDLIGARHLETICMDASLSVDVTARAVWSIATAQRLHPGLASAGKCADTVLAASDHMDTNTAYQRVDIMTMLSSMYREVPKNKADRMIAIAQNALGDKDPRVRLYASQALSKMGSTASIGLVRNALQIEVDPNTRVWLQRYLEALQKLQ